MADTADRAPLAQRTAWTRSLTSPVRDFLRTETGGAALVLPAIGTALVWANSPWSGSYESFWGTRLAITLGSGGVSASLRDWVNQGLMSLFFLVVGLEAKRQLDLGELRDRRRLAVPVLAAIGGIALPVGIFLAIQGGGHGSRGWGAAMSTDTAFALTILALLAARSATRMRVFLLTVAVVDDIAALVVIATVYTRHVSVPALAVALGLFGVLLALRYVPVGRGPLSIAVGVAVWVATFKSGIDPVVSGLAIGLATTAYPPSRADLERVTELARSFREQPTAELARSARRGVVEAISPNERLQYELHPWTSYVIVPLFALANAGVRITGGVLGHAVRSPITLGILVAYAVGKPLGLSAGSWLAAHPRLPGPRAPLSTPLLAASGACAGVGFTVSLLISDLAFNGEALSEAKLGALGTLLVAPALTWTTLRLARRLPTALRARQVARTAPALLDLSDEVDPDRDHVRGPDEAQVTLVEYGDFECPYCGRAERVIRELLSEHGDDVRYVWRHLPLNDVHPSAQLAAEASEAAATQGRFWEMYEILLTHQPKLTLGDLEDYARQLGLNVERFLDDLGRHAHAAHVSQDVTSADESGVSGTPTFFINGRRHYGAYDIDTLTAAVQSAKDRAKLVAVAGAQ